MVDWLFFALKFWSGGGDLRRIVVDGMVVLFAGGGHLNTTCGNQTFFVPGGGDPKT